MTWAQRVTIRLIAAIATDPVDCVIARDVFEGVMVDDPLADLETIGIAVAAVLTEESDNIPDDINFAAIGRAAVAVTRNEYVNVAWAFADVTRLQCEEVKP